KLEIQGFDEELSDLCRRMMSRRPDIRPSFDELVDKLGEISQRLGGRVPPRHQDVELIKSSTATDLDKPATDLDEPGRGRNSRAVAIAVIAGIAIGVGVTVGVIMMAS